MWRRPSWAWKPGTARRGLWVALFVPVLVAATSGGQNGAEPSKPARPSLEGPPIPGFVQLMERGQIPALVEPEFVAASDAEIPDEAWVLGFEHDGEAYAYSLNLLNHHEVVNHQVKGEPIAAVW